MTSHTFSRSASLTMLVIGVISGIIPALQGTLLPQLVKEGQLTLAELGQVAMAEAVGTLIAVSVVNAMLKPERLRLYVIATAIIGLLLDLVTAKLTGGGILAARFVHGLCAGVLLWVWVGFLTRADNPGRWVAIYVTVQAATLLVLSAWFSTALLPAGGAFAGFAVLAAFYGVMGLLAAFVPSQFGPLGHGDGSVMPDLKGWIGLFAVFTQLAAILALWVYLKPYGKQIGLSDDVTGLAVSVAMGSQIIAGLLATVMAGRVRAAPLIVFVAVGSVGSVAALAFAQEAVPFIVATTAFAFLWMLGPPFHMPYLIDIDPSRRSALHMTTAQLLGVAAGPAIASVAVSDTNVTGALIVAAGLYALGGLIIAGTALRSHAVAQPA
jgi:MFS transporter, DHA1 family, inner membrane transport protein